MTKEKKKKKNVDRLSRSLIADIQYIHLTIVPSTGLQMEIQKQQL